MLNEGLAPGQIETLVVCAVIVPDIQAAPAKISAANSAVNIFTLVALKSIEFIKTCGVFFISISSTYQPVEATLASEQKRNLILID